MNMSSRIAFATASAMLIGVAATPAKAADLGSGCCADLEERVAELEATTARKGNRVVSLQIYGDVTKGILFFDNGDDSDAYVVDNDALGSIVGFRGSATIKPGLTAGFKVELQVQDASSSAVSDDSEDAFIAFDGDPPGDDPDDNISIRHSNVYIESDRFGRVTLGQGSTAADGAAQVVLANTLINASPDHGTSIAVAGSGGFLLGEFASDFDAGRDDVIRYDSPSIYGFIVSASWGDDDLWDVALRFAKEWNSVRFAAAIAYQEVDPEEDPDEATETVIGSIAAMHVPTGLFASFHAGEKQLSDFDDVEGSFWYVQAGIEKRFLSYGATTFYGEYGVYDNVQSLAAVDDDVESEAERWGLGVVQNFESAAVDMYAQVILWDFESTFENGDTEDDLEDMSTIMVGSRIQF
jgi:predicted porin